MPSKVIQLSVRSKPAAKPQGRFANFLKDVVPEPVPKGEQPSKGWFICGPLPGVQIEIASRLPGKALITLLMVHHQCRLRREKEVTLPATLLTKVGVKTDAKLRALRRLEAAGLVTVTWELGHPPRIRLVEPN
jgi:hypothetical protein